MVLIDAEAGEILDRAMVARLATVSRNGRPHVNPLYFVRRDGHIHLGTATYTLAARNVGASPQVQVLFEVESDGDERPMVRMSGTAVVRTDPALMKDYRRGVTRKYIATPRGIWNLFVHSRQWLPMRRHLSGGAACVIDVVPSAAEWVTAP